MADGGRNAARGLRYQYLRTLEALMDAAEEPGRGVAAVHVEGLPAPDGKAPESIDYELAGAGGRTFMAAQVKARAPGTVMGAGEAFRALAGLVRVRDADRYALLTSAREGESVRELAALLGAGLCPGDLRGAIGGVLASAGGRQDLVAGVEDLEDEHLGRLDRAVIEFDPRGDGDVSESLRRRLRRYRNGARAGLGDESAGLLIGYLVSEVFRRAATPADATVLVSEFRSAALVDGATLARTLGRRDWGVVVGPVPRVPDVRRADLLERVQDALPVSTGTGPVPQCTLTGLSGIGKTSLAVGYLLERADLYDVIFWADAESETALASSFAGIFRYLHGEDAPEPADPARLREAVLTELSCAAGRWLLILDNCADERQADGWVPRAGDGHVIVTTLDSARPPQGDTRVEVGGMPAAQAVDLLTRRLAPEGPDGPQLSQLARLARELEGWPLALELAGAYLHRGGYGADGVPEYLERLKLPSLGHRESVPRGYPRTLIAAVELCLEKITQAAGQPEEDGGWAAMVAMGVLRVAAYMSSRRIPVYLAISVPAFDPDDDEAFRGLTPVVADSPDRPPAEAVGMLRSYSLAAPDERLPPYPGEDAGSSRYNYTITINSVLQEVMRARHASDPYTPLVIDRLAWHTERWMKAAFELGAHERALALAAHAAAIEEHASSLNLTTDFIAFLRGNLAAVEFRQHKKDRVIRLLRSEIEHYRGRGEEHAQLLTCQASMQLAAALADEGPVASLDEITALLEAAYFYLAGFAPERPEGTTFLLASARSVLNHLELAGVSDERLARLAAAVRDLAGRLPETPYSAAIGTADEIEACLHDHRDVPRAADLARTLLASEVAADDTQESAQLRAKARRSLIEALAVQHDMQGALTELGRFTADAQPPSVFVREIQDMLHNTGNNAALSSLMMGRQEAAELLAALLSEGRADLVRASYPGQTADRIGLLCGVSSYHQGDLPAARERLEEFLQGQSRCEGATTAQAGWRKLARLLADAIVARKTRAGEPAASAFRLISDGSLGRLQRLAPETQNFLALCEPDALPLIAALAVVHQELSGTPGARSVPACWQLHGALSHLGFDSEVMGAMALVVPGEDGVPEAVGRTQGMPTLNEDGRTDGHAVLWAKSFGLLVDPAIVLAPHVRAVAQGDPVLSFPVMLPVPDDREALLGPAMITSSSRPPLRLAWVLLPNWTQALNPAPGSGLDASVEAGKITLAHATLEILRELGRLRTDLGRMRARYPALASLLEGRRRLPPLPAWYRARQPGSRA